jgi:Fe(3+) dicitrate transport protein
MGISVMATLKSSSTYRSVRIGLMGASLFSCHALAIAEPDNATSALPDRVLVEGTRVSDDDKPWLLNRKTRYEHSLPEVDGPKITVTRRTSVEDLTTAPEVIDNAWRETLDRLPGLILAEQQNPSELNMSYRGIGNPQESEYVLALQDGIPMEMDFIGFPTLYYLPFIQTTQRVEMIRGGSGLLYGPEAAPVLNFVSRPIHSDSMMSVEQNVGNDGLLSSYVEGSLPFASGILNMDVAHRQSDGFRSNGESNVSEFDLKGLWQLNAHNQLKATIHAYQDDVALAGLMSYSQFIQNSNQTTTPNDHLWMNREQWILELDSQLSDKLNLTQKVYQQYAELSTRSLTYVNGVEASNSAVLNRQQFDGIGLDDRLLWRWGHGNALTVGVSGFQSTSPYQIYKNAPDEVDGTSRGVGTLSFNDQRRTEYAALFGENVFRFKSFHALISARVDHEALSADQTIAPHPLVGPVSTSKTMPLWGLGLGNDFGKGNETYFNISEGFRPVRYLDISNPNSYLAPQNAPKPTQYQNTELGVHGWPLKGFYYDVGLFNVKTTNRIESEHLTTTEVVDVNTGNTVSRGLEAESSIDLSSYWNAWPIGGVKLAVPLEWSQALTLLDGHFTQSSIAGQVGKIPAYAPPVSFKSSLRYGDPQSFSVRLVYTHVASQFFQDANVMVGSTPAQIPAYSVIDLHASGALTKHLNWDMGINNLNDRIYYSRVFLSGGTLEPAPRREIYIGLKAAVP